MEVNTLKVLANYEVCANHLFLNPFRVGVVAYAFTQGVTLG
jgi:hypothetical protein